MTTENQDKWERTRVQRVLDYHNKKYVTNIEIKGKATDIYPQLVGQLNWDWTCYDTETSDEIAVEVKRQTDETLELKRSTIREVLKEIGNDLSNKLPGIFSLSIDITQDYHLPFDKPKNRRQLKNVLYKTIFESAQKLKVGETEELESKIVKQLPFALPDISSIRLQKYSDVVSALYIFSGIPGAWSLKLNKSELADLEEQISQANDQLKQATNAKATILIIIEERERITDYVTDASALKQINHDSYSHINHIYYVSFEKVEEIPLPILE